MIVMVDCSYLLRISSFGFDINVGLQYAHYVCTYICMYVLNVSYWYKFLLATGLSRFWIKRFVSVYVRS